MPSIKDLKKRIQTVKNTQQTTRAMKMVSAAKLRRAQEAVVSHRPYAKELSQILSTVLGQKGLAGSDSDQGSQWLGRASDTERDPNSKRVVLAVVVSSDRGLCGGFNASIYKAAMRWESEQRKLQNTPKFFTIGRRSGEFLSGRFGAEALIGKEEVGPKVNFKRASQWADRLLELYKSGAVDEIVVIYSEFKNAMTITVMEDQWLPVTPTEPTSEAAGVVEQVAVKPGVDEIIGRLFIRNLKIQIYRALLESQASEHGARMTAMESATKNAGDMIRKLTLLFNKQRQAGITKELLEITAGAESQKTN